MRERTIKGATRDRILPMRLGPTPVSDSVIPFQIFPTHEAIDVPFDSALLWNSHNFPSGSFFQLEINSSPDFTGTAISVPTFFTTSYWNFSSTSLDTVYYWRVRSVINGIPTDYSSVRSFRTYAIPVPFLIETPETLDIYDYTLEWILKKEELPGFIYKLEISKSENFSDFLVSIETSNKFYTLTEYEKDTTYYWRVKTLSVLPEGESHYSIVSNFKTPKVESPLLDTPLNFANAFSGELRWQPERIIPGMQFEVEISSDILFTSGNVFNVPQITNLTHYQVNNLHSDTFYFWRIRTISPFGNSEFSQIRTFKTPYIKVPELIRPLDNATMFLGEMTWQLNDPLATDIQYKLDINTSENFNEDAIDINSPLSENFFNLKYDYLNHTEYYWRVSTVQSWGYSLPSETRKFKTPNQFNVIPDVINYGTINILEVPLLYQNEPTIFHKTIYFKFFNVVSPNITIHSTNPRYTISTNSFVVDSEGLVFGHFTIIYTPDTNNILTREDNTIIEFRDNHSIVLEHLTCFAHIIAKDLNYWGSPNEENLITSGNVYIPSEINGDVVVKKYNNLTISEGDIFTTSEPCKGLAIYVYGDCIINGTLTMTAKGAFLDPNDFGDDGIYGDYNKVINLKINVFTTENKHNYQINDRVEFTPSDERTSILEGGFTVIDIIDDYTFTLDCVGLYISNVTNAGKVRKIIKPAGFIFKRKKLGSFEVNTEPASKNLYGLGDNFIVSEEHNSIDNNGKTYILPRLSTGYNTLTNVFKPGKGGNSVGHMNYTLTTFDSAKGPDTGLPGTCFGGGSGWSYNSDFSNGITNMNVQWKDDDQTYKITATVYSGGTNWNDSTNGAQTILGPFNNAPAVFNTPQRYGGRGGSGKVGPSGAGNPPGWSNPTGYGVDTLGNGNTRVKNNIYKSIDMGAISYGWPEGYPDGLIIPYSTRHTYYPPEGIGTGGVIYLFVRGNLIIGDNGKIESKGSPGQPYLVPTYDGMVLKTTPIYKPGSGSGGGCALILYGGNFTNTGSNSMPNDNLDFSGGSASANSTLPPNSLIGKGETGVYILEKILR